MAERTVHFPKLRGPPSVAPESAADIVGKVTALRERHAAASERLTTARSEVSKCGAPRRGLEGRLRILRQEQGKAETPEAVRRTLDAIADVAREQQALAEAGEALGARVQEAALEVSGIEEELAKWRFRQRYQLGRIAAAEQALANARQSVEHAAADVVRQREVSPLAALPPI